MSSSKKNLSKKRKNQNKIQNKTNTNTNTNTNGKKEKFNESTTASSYTDLIDLLSVSITAGDKPITWKDQLQDYGILFIKYLFLVTIFTLNFLGLSVSLNCNSDQEMGHRVLSAIFAFFFGFVYLIVNYYTYKVLSQGKICKMDREKLFPFKM